MKKLICLSIVLNLAFLVACTTEPNDDDDDGWDAAKVCPETGTNAYGMPNRGTFTDERDGQVYKYTTIGDQVWMAENLNYDAPYSHCEDVFEDSCRTFGRFYCFFENGDIDFERRKIDQSLLKSTCPVGWHIPSEDEWNALFLIMEKNAVTKLKGEDFWGYYRGKGENNCAFGIRPSGKYGYSGVNSLFLFTAFASSTLISDTEQIAIFFESDISSGTGELKMSVRCVKD
ncbi:MAG: hypothetical protein J6T62_12380 [Fibrobacter sp.]|nr:hypothetical protein [Fibrobacter sp.]